MANIHKAADYFEPLLRVRIVRALKALRASVRVKDITIALSHKAPALVVLHVNAKDFAPAIKVVRDAIRQGGKLGAAQVPQ